MKPLLLRTLGLGSIVVAFALIGLLIARVLGLEGWQWWTLLVAFVALGGLMAWIVYLFLRARRRSAPIEEAVPAAADLEATWGEAQARLTASRRLDDGRIGRIPLMLVLGPANSAKTTAVLRSGIEPELLAGSAMDGDAVVPTRGINAWFGGGWLFVEAAQDVLDNPERWGWTTRAVRPDRLAAALSGARQAPRGVILCYPCARLLEAAGGLRAEAQSIRAKLTELAESLGVNIPVYLLLTKLDQVSNFTDYTRSLTTDESREILGATLRRGRSSSAESYAQSEANQVGRAFDSIVRTLGIRRTDLLQRETANEIRVGAYEFPRELSKLRSALSDFIVELGRPTQFGVGPFMRGFYFTGVRPIVVDSGSGFAPSAAAPSPSASGATMVFNPQTGAPVQAGPPVGGSRRVPQWVFLPRLIREVVFNDRAALGVTEGGIRVSALRRTLLGLATAASLVLAVGFISSYVANRSLERRVVAAAQRAAASAPAGGQPSPTALADLDTLGTHVLTLREFEQEGPPIRYRWGLYPGNRLLQEARRVYFAGFGRVLGADMLAALTASLQASVREQNPIDRQSTYDALKAYLMTHDRNDRAAEGFLPAELLRHWGRNRSLDPETEAVTVRQFATYARELPYGEPLGAAHDSALVEFVRTYLVDAAAEDRIYQALTASVTAPDVRFAPGFGGQRIVSNSSVVTGAYTKQGWAEFTEKLGGSLVADEDWVTAAPVPPPDDIEALRTTLRNRYVADYKRQWQAYLGAGSVGGFGTLNLAFQSLEVVGDPGSPLLGMIALASDHTGAEAVDEDVARAFAPAHYIVAPDSGTISEAIGPYLQAVNSLATSLRIVSESSGEERERERRTALSDARRATQAVSQIALQMNPDVSGEAARRQIRRLLEAPIERAQGVLGSLPAEGLNAAAAEFCRDMNALERLYPFDQRSGVDADPETVGFAFGAQSSVLWNFYERSLRGVIAEVGGRFRPAADAPLRPTSRFVEYFDRAARVSRGLYPGDSGDIEILMSVALPPPPGVDEIVLEVGAQRIRFTDRDRASKTLVWVPDPTGQVRIEALVADIRFPVIEEGGTWSLFRVFEQGDWASQGRDTYSVTWRNSSLAQPLSGRVTFETGVDILNPALIGNVSCVSTLVR